LKDDEERFKMDVSMRADDISAKSEAYVHIPVEEFGAALLRGMGWTGPTAEDEEREKKGEEPLIPRDARYLSIKYICNIYVSVHKVKRFTFQ
jgi:hypothetical protein